MKEFTDRICQCEWPRNHCHRKNAMDRIVKIATWNANGLTLKRSKLIYSVKI